MYKTTHMDIFVSHMANFIQSPKANGIEQIACNQQSHANRAFIFAPCLLWGVQGWDKWEHPGPLGRPLGLQAKSLEPSIWFCWQHWTWMHACLPGIQAWAFLQAKQLLMYPKPRKPKQSHTGPCQQLHYEETLHHQHGLTGHCPACKIWSTSIVGHPKPKSAEQRACAKICLAFWLWWGKYETQSLHVLWPRDSPTQPRLPSWQRNRTPSSCSN